MPRNRRPRLRIELPQLGLLDPFRLQTAEHPSGSGEHCLWMPVDGAQCGDAGVSRVAVERAGLCLAGASEALFHLSFRWMQETGSIEERPGDRPEEQSGDGRGHGPGYGLGNPGRRAPVQMRLALERREGRLLAALLRRHLRRLPQPTPWMATLLRSLEEMDDYLSWQEPSVR